MSLAFERLFFLFSSFFFSFLAKTFSLFFSFGTQANERASDPAGKEVRIGRRKEGRPREENNSDQEETRGSGKGEGGFFEEE